MLDGEIFHWSDQEAPLRLAEEHIAQWYYIYLTNVLMLGLGVSCHIPAHAAKRRLKKLPAIHEEMKEKGCLPWNLKTK